jgi:hypothetical protein
MGSALMVFPSLPIIIPTRAVLLDKTLEEQMEYHEGTCDNHRKPPTTAIIFPDSQMAIDGILDDWLPRLIQRNETLIAVLLSIKRLCSVESSSVIAQRVLAEVDAALERDARAQKGF